MPILNGLSSAAPVGGAAATSPRPSQIMRAKAFIMFLHQRRQAGSSQTARRTSRDRPGMLGLAPPSALGRAASTGHGARPNLRSLFSLLPLSLSHLVHTLSPRLTSPTHIFLFPPREGWGAPTGARVLARHPDLRAMTGARRLSSRRLRFR